MHSGEELTPPQAEQAVRLALTKCGYPPWRAMNIDIFQGSGGALLIAFPSEDTQIHMADYAFEFLREYFTD